MKVEIYIKNGNVDHIKVNGKEVPIVIIAYGAWNSDIIEYYVDGYKFLTLKAELVEPRED